jgi:pantoate--beta-alanine ligase
MPLIHCQNLQQLREQIKHWRNENETVAFVPTMGNLHAGHLSLVEIAREKAARVVVSIYVNPLQFSPDEDFASYPRTLQEDLNKLDAAGVDLVFTPETKTIYPDGEQRSTFVEVPQLSQIIEGKSRPGFFKGVATVVLKLFNMVQPDYAIFGEKDFQQLLVIRKMVNDLNLPIEIIGAAIKREQDGLAMSSRNNYLSSPEREKSCLLSETLRNLRHQIEQGLDIDTALRNCIETLQGYDFVVDYVTLRDAAGLENVSNDDILNNRELVILAAARMGKTRLIDNVKFVIVSHNDNKT